ncbi:hypothetical protein [Brachybacterium epidermidis]|uniref:hypothetical protein n=1 Tax=Brachybacterium epidermidis TaxID=2781983 RepID=UPI003D724CCE
MAAAVADAGQGVVLGENRDGRRVGRSGALAADLGADRRVQAVHAELGVDAVALEDPHDRGGGAVLLEGDLGMLGEVDHQVDELGAGLVDLLLEPGAQRLRGAGVVGAGWLCVR